MGHYFNVLTRTFYDPWTWYFFGAFVLCALVYVFGDRWDK